MPRKKPKYEDLTVQVPAYLVDSINPGTGCSDSERKLFARRIRLLDFLCRSKTKALSYRTIQTIMGQHGCTAEIKFLLQAGVLTQLSKGYHRIKDGLLEGAAARYDLVLDPDQPDQTHYTLRASIPAECAAIAEMARGQRLRASGLARVNNWSGVRLGAGFDYGAYIAARRERLQNENRTEIDHWSPSGKAEKLSIQDHLMRLMRVMDDIQAGRDDAIWVRKSAACGRLTTTWSVLPRDLREYLVDSRGQKLVEVDLRACHPHLLPILLGEWTRKLVESEGFGRAHRGKGFRSPVKLGRDDHKTLAEQVVDLQAEIHNYERTLAEHDDWYAYLSDCVQGSTRDDVKSAIMWWLNRAHDDRCWGMMEKITHYLEDRWPRINKMLAIKRRSKVPSGDYAKSYIACQLMLLESRIVLPIARKLAREGKICISIHDALLVSPETVHEAKELLEASYPGAKTKIKSLPTVATAVPHTTTTKQEKKMEQYPHGITKQDRNGTEYWAAYMRKPEGGYAAIKKSTKKTTLDEMIAIVTAAKGVTIADAASVATASLQHDTVANVVTEEIATASLQHDTVANVVTEEIATASLQKENVVIVATPEYSGASIATESLHHDNVASNEHSTVATVATDSEIAELRLMIDRQNNQMLSDYGAMREWSAGADARIATLEKQMADLTAWAGNAHGYLEKLLHAGSQAARADMSAGPSELQQAALVMQSHHDLVDAVQTCRDEAGRLRKCVDAIHTRLSPLENTKKIKDQSIHDMENTLTHMRNTVSDCRSIQTIQGQQIAKIQDRIKATDEEAHHLRLQPHKEASHGLVSILVPGTETAETISSPCGTVVDGEYVPGWALDDNTADPRNEQM